MEVKVSEGPAGARTIGVEVPWADVEADYSFAVAEYGKKVRIPGFRKGKVPIALVKRQFGKIIEAELSEELTKRYYDEAVRSSGLTPIDRGKVSNITLAEGTSFSFTATFDVEPDFDVYDYEKGLEVVKPVYQMNDGAVEMALEDLRERHAEVRAVDSGAKDGDFLEVDIQEVDRSRMPIIGRRVERRLIKIGEGIFGGPGAVALMGANAGDERFIELPGSNRSEPGTWYKITVHKVEEHDLPVLDEAFVRKVDSSLKTVDELSERVRESIRRRLLRESQEALHRDLADAMVRQTEVTPPKRLIEGYLDSVVADASERGESQVDEALLRQKARPRAVWNIKWLLIRNKIIRQEQITVDEAEVDARISAFSHAMNLEEEKGRLLGASPDYRQRVREDLLEEKVLELLAQRATVREETIPASTRSGSGGLAAAAAA